MNAIKIQNEIYKTIDIIVKERLKNLSFNYYLDGKIKTDNGDGTYVVTINTEDYTLKARSGLTLNINDLVLVCVKNNNSSDKFIDLKRP